MKKSALVALCLITMFLTTRAHAQARFSSKTDVLSINPLALAFNGPVDLQFEWKSTPTNSWVIRGIFWPTYLGYSAFGLGGAYRFYIADSRAVTGLNAAPALDVYFFTSGTAGVSGATIFAVGGDLAYKWIFNQFSIEPLLGLRIGILGGSQGVGYGTGFLPKIALYLGYAW